MTLEESIQAQFKGFSPAPERHTANLAHLYADYAEFLAVLQNGDWFAESDLVKRFKDYDVRVPGTSLKVAGPAGDDEPTPAEVEDQYDRWAQQVFSQIEERSLLFQADYPFEVKLGCIRLSDTIESRQKVYLMLLLCSNLKYVPKLEPVLTAEFEHLAAEALQEFLPDNAIVKQFGKNSDYAGTAQQKIRALANDMNVDINDREVNKILGNQERGLDVVGWIPFRDKYANFLSVFAQCACGMEWHSKLGETRRFDNSYFVFAKLRPMHALFVPRGLVYRNDLYQSDELSDVLLFERSRILEMLPTVDFFEAFGSKKIVEYCVKLEEDVV